MPFGDYRQGRRRMYQRRSTNREKDVGSLGRLKRLLNCLLGEHFAKPDDIGANLPAAMRAGRDLLRVDVVIEFYRAIAGDTLILQDIAMYFENSL